MMVEIPSLTRVSAIIATFGPELVDPELENPLIYKGFSDAFFTRK